MAIKQISLIVPCYNEEESIHEFYQRVYKLSEEMKDQSFEFVFVDDGSIDGTGRILDDLAAKDKRVKVLHLAQNRGHQIAIQAGIDHATGDMIVTLDADLQHPPELVVEMLEKIQAGYDIVHAQRKKRTGDTWFKRSTAQFYYFLMRMFSGVQLIEDSGDFRAFTKSVQETLFLFRTQFLFLRGTFVKIGFRQCIIPYQSEKRFAGETKYSLLKMLRLAIDGILGFSDTPIKIIIWLSLLLWSFSLIHLGVSLYSYLVLHMNVPGWTSVIVLMFFFTGLILFSMAIIGSYVGRIFQQSQNQPLYWLHDSRNLDAEIMSERARLLREVRLSKQIIDRT